MPLPPAEITVTVEAGTCCSTQHLSAGFSCLDTSGGGSVLIFPVAKLSLYAEVPLMKAGQGRRIRDLEVSFLWGVGFPS